MHTADRPPRRFAVSFGKLVVVAATAALLAAGLTAAVIRLNTGPVLRSPGVDIAVIGDSYSSGRANRVVWPTLLADRTGLSVANFALPRAGFANDGEGGWAFTYQMDRALRARPGTVLIVGGLDDGNVTGTSNIAQGANEALSKAVRDGQRVLVVGPTWYETPLPPEVADASKEIRQAAENAHVPFLDAVDPPWLSTELMKPDHSGPTDEGQSVIADKIAAWLRTEIPA